MTTRSPLARPSDSLTTLAIHHGEIRDVFGSPRTPLYSTTTFRFDSSAELLEVVEGKRPGCLYTRYGSNPTINTLEAKLAALDHAEAALAFGSGMAAISATLLAHGQGGIVCVGDVYGGTWQLLTEQLPRLGLRCIMLNVADLPRLPETLVQYPGGLLYFESPSNPTLEILDIRQLVVSAHQHSLKVAIDNTFASPINQQPHALGVDLVIQSATKYLGGHSDITAGVVCGRQQDMTAIATWRKNLGQIIAPEVAHLLVRSLATLELRVLRQNANAQQVAQAMTRHPRIKRVLYPGLADFPGHAIARRQMSGFGGMLSLDIDGSGADAARVIDRLRLIALAPSLGGVESLASQPCTTSHHDLSAEERLQHGISDSLIRLSIGIEDVQDLIDDLNQALTVLEPSAAVQDDGDE